MKIALTLAFGILVCFKGCAEYMKWMLTQDYIVNPYSPIVEANQRVLDYSWVEDGFCMSMLDEMWSPKWSLRFPKVVSDFLATSESEESVFKIMD